MQVRHAARHRDGHCRPADGVQVRGGTFELAAQNAEGREGGHAGSRKLTGVRTADRVVRQALKMQQQQPLRMHQRAAPERCSLGSSGLLPPWRSSLNSEPRCMNLQVGGKALRLVAEHGSSGRGCCMRNRSWPGCRVSAPAVGVPPCGHHPCSAPTEQHTSTSPQQLTLTQWPGTAGCSNP